MFGYVKPLHSELKVCENELYRAVYCGLCRSMGKCCGNLSRFMLNYDYVFLALLRISLTGEECTVGGIRCAVHPLKKRLAMQSNPTLEYCARMSARLAYYKVRDNIDDGAGLKKLAARICLPMASYSRRRAEKAASETGGTTAGGITAGGTIAGSTIAGGVTAGGTIAGGLSELRLLENERVGSVDRPASEFGRIMAHVFSDGLGEKQAAIAYEVGYHLGRWIYITDALDDIEDDAAQGNYNPFLVCYGTPSLSGDQRASIGAALNSELIAIEAALNLRDPCVIPGVDNIIWNIVYLGLRG